jgi:conjugative relaxase-like TrwC/TraI family protein
MGARFLSLEGGLKAEEFERLLRGYKPHSNERLNPHREVSETTKQAALDLTFSAPKSVSLAALVGGDTRLEAAHREAVSEALRVAERRYAATRIGSKTERQVEHCQNLVAAKFHHNTSRVKDPQLHTHAVVVNAVLRSDGVWRSLHNREIFSNAKLLGLVYQNELAARAKALGYTIERKPKGTFELAGYSEKELRAFSKRREQIEKLGAKNQFEARTLVRKNRPAKGRDLSPEELRTRWQREAAVLGIKHPVAHEHAYIEPRHERCNHRIAVALGAHHASEKEVNFKKEKLEAYALSSNLGDVDLGKLAECFEEAKADRFLRACKQGGYTTARAVEAEQIIVTYLRRGKENVEPIVRDLPKSVLNNDYNLNPEQLAAVKNVLTTRDQFVAWQGVAGAGKTYALCALYDAAKLEGYHFSGFAPSATAAHVLQTETAFASRTLASVLLDERTQALGNDRSIYVIDEAGLMSTSHCAHILAVAKRNGSRVLFVGDTRQLSGVEAGNPFRLMQKHGIDMAELTEGRRQKSPELKVAVDLMAEKKVRQSLDGIAAKIVEVAEEKNRAALMAREYVNMKAEERAETLILAGTNKEREKLTGTIRETLKTKKELGDGPTICTLKSRDLSREERSDAANFPVGDVLLFHKEARSIGAKKGEPYEIFEVAAREGILRAKSQRGENIALHTEKLCDAYTVYEKRSMEVSVGDRVRITRNNKELGVRNGEEFLVEKTDDGRLALKAKDEKRVEFALSEPLHIDHNYVNTVYSSQGKTCNKCLISVDRTFGREAMYVAMSRARFDVKIFTPSKEAMVELVSQSRAKVAALEVVAEASVSKELREVRSYSQQQSQGHSCGRGMSM